MNKKLLSDFRSPGSEYRAAPFWAWNDRLEPEELRRQIRLLHRGGLGGFFMHSRVGMATPYLSEEWFDCVKTCVDEAKKLGMLAWLYDEDRWPSGAAGGLVTKNPRHRLRFLALETLKRPRDLKWTSDVLAAFTVRVVARERFEREHPAAPEEPPRLRSGRPVVTDVRRLRRGARPRKLARGETILAFRMRTQAPSSWYNDQAYLDTLSREAVAEFIKVTHDAYAKHIGKDFGTVVPGIFTDEPNFGHGGGGGTIPWTPKLPRVFRKRYGYDILDHAVELFYDVDGRAVTPARYHYNDCRTHLFVDAFAKQIGRWCQRHGIGLTGHALVEDTLTMQAGAVGSCIRFYEHMQIPGMDELTERWRIWDTAKQVASAANQFGRKWRLTETYGCTGWDFAFEGHKAIGDWQAALGINIRSQHLPWYSMEGQRKRDYPASIFYQSPWWPWYRKVEDYFARIHAVMTRGREVRDLLVLHPVESAWLTAGTPEGADLDATFIRLRDSLIAGSIDFDYGDEEILLRHAKVARTRNGPALRVNKASYRIVLVPPMLTMRGSTLRLLKRFRAGGGAVVFAGAPARYLDARPSRAVESFAAQCPRAPEKGARLVAAVEARARRIAVRDGRGRYVPTAPFLLREDAGAFYLFVCNTSQKPGELKKGRIHEPRVCDRPVAYPDVRITGFAGCAGAPLELDPESGRVYAADARRLGGGWEIRTSFPRLGSRLFVVPKKSGGTRRAGRPQYRDVRSAAPAPRRWDIRLSEPNVLVLDRPRYRVGAGAWKGPDEILRVDNAARDALGIQRRGGRMCQPWAVAKNATTRRVPVALVYTFDVKTVPGGELALGLEKPDTFDIRLNGAPVDAAPCGWWCDRTLLRVPLDAALLRRGRNELRLVCDYDEGHSGLEIAYLLGDFGVTVRGTALTMVAPPRSLRLGDWVPQGLPFYAGAVAYRRTVRPGLRRGQRLFVQVPDFRGTVVRVLVDGREAGLIAWEPREVDITDFVGKGPADLAVEVVSHRRNSHGPLHLHEKWPAWTGAGQFTTTGREWTDNYQLVPCGLMKPPRLVVRK